MILAAVAAWAGSVALIWWWVSAATSKGRRFEEQREMAKRRHPSGRP